MISPYGRVECAIIAGVTLLLLVLFGWLGWWIFFLLAAIAGVGLILFFRDPQRVIPKERNVMVAPADGKVTLVDTLDHFEPLNGPAMRIRIFLSVLDVHVNRCPLHAMVRSVTHTPGTKRNALYEDSARTNESVLMVLEHPVRKTPVAAVKQIVGAIARRIVCQVSIGTILQRGQRYGMIKFGSTTELYIPTFMAPEAAVRVGDRVWGGSTVLARLHGSATDAPPADDMSETGSQPAPSAPENQAPEAEPEEADQVLSQPPPEEPSPKAEAADGSSTPQPEPHQSENPEKNRKQDADPAEAQSRSPSLFD